MGAESSDEPEAINYNLSSVPLTLHRSAVGVPIPSSLGDLIFVVLMGIEWDTDVPVLTLYPQPTTVMGVS